MVVVYMVAFMNDDASMPATPDRYDLRPPLRSVLFVDFENVHLGLNALGADIGAAFAEQPNKWVEWLESGGEGQDAVRRRFLTKCVYLNPHPHRDMRAVFIRSGFRVVDCPSLTAAGKNSADISMALDIVDALAADVRYEEFVIVSADADFTPVLHRIRAMDRRATLVAGSNASPALRAVADVFVSADDLAAEMRPATDGADGEASADDPTPSADDATPSDRDDALAPDAATAGGVSQSELARALARVRALVEASDVPVVSARAAQVALDEAPNLKATRWMGKGSFRGFLAGQLTELSYVPHPQPGYVLDPRRHHVDQVPGERRERLSPLLERVCFVTDTPALTSEEYGELFRALADHLQRQPFSLTETSKAVRDATALAAVPVARHAINFVLKGLIYAHVDLDGGHDARHLADAWARNVLELARGAQMSLDDDEREQVERWVTGDLEGSVSGAV